MKPNPPLGFPQSSYNCPKGLVPFDNMGLTNGPLKSLVHYSTVESRTCERSLNLAPLCKEALTSWTCPNSHHTEKTVFPIPFKLNGGI